MPALLFALAFALLAQGGPVRSLPSLAEPRSITHDSPHGGEDATNGTHAATPEPVSGSGSNSSTVSTRFSSILKDLPTIKNVVIVVCGFTAFLIACLMFKIFRSGRRIRKTRKYDIITTPAERVEMAPLNEENDDEEDSTVFDVKYR
ncbi:membrane protein FAM174B isoform X2 [Ambystoma mexicanum]